MRLSFACRDGIHLGVPQVFAYSFTSRAGSPLPDFVFLPSITRRLFGERHIRRPVLYWDDLLRRKIEWGDQVYVTTSSFLSNLFCYTRNTRGFGINCVPSQVRLESMSACLQADSEEPLVANHDRRRPPNLCLSGQSQWVLPGVGRDEKLRHGLDPNKLHLEKVIHSLRERW